MINVRSQGQVNRVCVTLDAASAAHLQAAMIIGVVIGAASSIRPVAGPSKSSHRSLNEILSG